HLAGLLMAGRSTHTEVTGPALAETAADVTHDREGGHRRGSWPRLDDRSNGHATGHVPTTAVMTSIPTAIDHGHVRDAATAMTAAEARQAVVRLVRERGGGGDI